MSKLLTVIAIAVQLFTSTASADCLVQTIGGLFPVKYSAILVEKGYTVRAYTGYLPSDSESAERHYLRNIVNDGEYAVYAGGLLRGGFELYKKTNGNFDLVAAEWSYTETSSTVMKRSVPACNK